MRRLLVINPNTTASMTALLQRHAQAAAGPQMRVDAVTARLGAPYIADEATFAVAGHAALDAWAAALAAGTAPDAVLVGCFGDPGLLALRQASPVPVTGLAEGAMARAARAGRFAIVTGGAHWRPMLQRLARELGHEAVLADVLAVAPTGAQMAADPDSALAVLARACAQAAALPGVRSVILGGAGLAGLAARLQDRVPVPLIDSVEAGTLEALSAVGGGRSVAGFDGPWVGLSPEMQALASAS